MKSHIPDTRHNPNKYCIKFYFCWFYCSLVPNSFLISCTYRYLTLLVSMDRFWFCWDSNVSITINLFHACLVFENLLLLYWDAGFLVRLQMEACFLGLKTYGKGGKSLFFMPFSVVLVKSFHVFSLTKLISNVFVSGMNCEYVKCSKISLCLSRVEIFSLKIMSSQGNSVGLCRTSEKLSYYIPLASSEC